ncbi:MULTISPECIES: alpha/beta fold hydrolase [unclassified Kitasatospora]|uniref:alpha/beta fold hydrolase n=1 Tax=unclassified Kitasatospora TaxID=2633591 RepID=UPI00070AF751|nr:MULTISPECIES: alpha/beta hydrolase [unclassified Kitasatospora]KQV13948.1 peptidase S33 [Kitasatospora sp. Root107]KRB68928.1 peptidase S33 [Kitasatospora sp. Root187]
MPIFSSYDHVGIWYESAGAGDPLVVLGGGPGTDSRYLGDLGGLDRQHRLIFMDGRAAGRSEVPVDRGTVSFVAQARDVEELRLHLGLERFDLLAHSAGCLTAQEYLAAYPGRVRRAVLVTPVGRVGREPDPAELAELKASRSGEPWYEKAAEADRRLAEGTAADAELAVLQVWALPFSWYRWSRERLAEYRHGHASSVPWLRDAFYAGAPGPGELAGRLARLSAGSTPVLVLAGAADGLIGTVPARQVAECHPGSRLEVMTESGHRPWVEEPERFVAEVTAFLTAGR